MLNTNSLAGDCNHSKKKAQKKRNHLSSLDYTTIAMIAHTNIKSKTPILL